MDVNNEIVESRRYGIVRCGLSSLTAPSLPELASEFGLPADRDLYREIDEASAKTSVVRLLRRDMAYDAEVMPVDRAIELADRFFAQFGPRSRYFTNNNCPVTAATFDEGFLVLGRDLSGCLWVEDED